MFGASLGVIIASEHGVGVNIQSVGGCDHSIRAWCWCEYSVPVGVVIASEHGVGINFEFQRIIGCDRGIRTWCWYACIYTQEIDIYVCVCARVCVYILSFFVN